MNAHKEDRFLRGRQIAFLIYEYFRVFGAKDSVENYADLFTIVLRNDDTQEFDSKWDENLLSMTVGSGSQGVNSRAPPTGGRQWCCRDSRTKDMVLEPQDSRIWWVLCEVYSTRRQHGSTVENRGGKTLIISTAFGSKLRNVTFQVANVNEALDQSQGMVKNGNRVVLDVSGTFTEKMTNDILWLRERDAAHIGT